MCQRCRWAAAGWRGLCWELRRRGGAGYLRLRAGGRWGLQEKRCWFVVLGLLLLHVGVLRPVGAEAQPNHALRATYVRAAAWGGLGGDTLGTALCLHSP